MVADLTANKPATTSNHWKITRGRFMIIPRWGVASGKCRQGAHGRWHAGRIWTGPCPGPNAIIGSQRCVWKILQEAIAGVWCWLVAATPRFVKGAPGRLHEPIKGDACWSILHKESEDPRISLLPHVSE